MTRKTSECYKAVFDFIERNLFKLQPNEIITDYENGMRKAIKECWPEVELHGCWFHYCQAIRKRCRKHNLTKLLKKNRSAKIIQKSIMSLPLLPAELIKEGYDCIKKFARKKRQFKRFNALFKYFERYWLKQVPNAYFIYFSNINLCYTWMCK